MPFRTNILLATMSKAFDYFKIVGSLKQVERTGWVRCQVKNPESVAEHMYRMAMMSWAIPSSSNLDKDKCMKIALVHDMAESMVGDITPWCGVSKAQKQEMEEKATAHICSLVGEEAGKEMYSLWMEYETQSSPEARFVKDVDKFEMLVQAFEYEQRDNLPGSRQDFYDHTAAKYKFQTSLVEGWFTDLMEKRAATLSSQPQLQQPEDDSLQHSTNSLASNTSNISAYSRSNTVEQIFLSAAGATTKAAHLGATVTNLTNSSDSDNSNIVNKTMLKVVNNTNSAIVEEILSASVETEKQAMVEAIGMGDNPVFVSNDKKDGGSGKIVPPSSSTSSKSSPNSEDSTPPI